MPDPATIRDGQFTADDTPIAGVVLQLGDGSGAQDWMPTAGPSPP